MQKKRSKTNRQRTHPREAALKNRAKDFLKAEREYWREQVTLVARYNEVSESLTGDPAVRLKPLSSVVWALRDGAAFVRYETFAAKPSVEFRVLDVTLEEWRKNASVPTKNGEVPTAPIGISHGCQLINVAANNNEIPYAAFLLMKYGESHSPPSVEHAVEDFRLMLLGFAAAGGVFRSPARRENDNDTVSRLEQELAEFAQLLEDATKEGQLQTFLKEHPFILDPSGRDVVPKKKLGEDFVTDFVLVSPMDQGPKYTLVEIERSNLPIFTEKDDLSYHVTHAFTQTLEWNSWLEQNKAYLQQKLIGFESPDYLIIIGRSKGLTIHQKALLRAYNRIYVNTQLLTYDDVLAMCESAIQKLKLPTRPR